MNNILLISEDTLKTYSNLNDNTFGKWILPAIKESQEMGLMPIIGECLYNKICELVADGSINDILFTAYKDLLDDKIQPYLIYKTLSNIIPILNAKMANIGTVLTNDEHVVNLTQGESDLLKTYYSERCDFYTKRLQDFIKNNQSAFPEISCGCGNIQPNLESSENSVGVWLGGSRGKKIGDNKCACSSTEVICADYQSGFTDGVEFQKRKLQITAVTENGRYISEDGFKEIAVDVPTGSTINNQDKNITITANTATTITFDSGYTGLGNVGINVNVPQTGHTDEELEEAYNNGYSDGYRDGSGDYLNKYLTFESITSGSYYFKATDVIIKKTLEWSSDGNNWNEVTCSSSGTLITNVNVGDKIYFRGVNDSYCDIYSSSYFSSTCMFKAYGNIMSIIYGDNYSGKTNLTKEHALCSLFYYCTGLTSAENLILPATTLVESCYQMMFDGCTNLTKAPELPATTLADYCYAHMFYGCSSLNYIKCLATDISASSCTNNWVYGVAATGVFIKATSMSNWLTGDSGIQTGWVTIDNS